MGRAVTSTTVRKRLCDQFLRPIPLERCLRWTGHPQHVWTYHVVSDRPLPHIRHLYPSKTSDMFRRDIEYLSRTHTIRSYEEALAARGDGRPPHALITFDDGRSEVFSVVRPILVSFETTAVCFVATDFVDNRKMLDRHKMSLCVDRVLSCNAQPDALERASRFCGQRIACPLELFRSLRFAGRRSPEALDELLDLMGIDIRGYLKDHRPYLTRGQIRRLSSDGFTIGAHTKTHRPLDELSPHELMDEIVGSCEIVSHITGSKPVPFAVPFRSQNLDIGVVLRARRESAFVGPIFVADGVTLPLAEVMTRIDADSPAGASYRRSNLPRLLRRHYLRRVVRKVSGLQR